MATIKIQENIIFEEHNEQYQEIKKKFPTGDIEYSYEYGVLIDNSQPDMSTKDAYVKSIYSKWGVSIQGKQGRKSINLLIHRISDPIINIPSTIKKSLEENYDVLSKKELISKNKDTNLDSILKKVGKEGSASIKSPESPSVMNGHQLFGFMQQIINSPKPTFPTLEDLKKAEPQIYQSYINKADGTKVVSFKPGHKESDEWGFLITPTIGGYKPLKKENNRIRIIFDDVIHGCILFDENVNKDSNVIDEWLSLQHTIIKKFNKAKGGEEFIGWKGAKEYKLTAEEISSLIKERIFEPKLII